MVNNYYELIVLGGGTSGVISAISAARKGIKTLLVERYGYLGGSSNYGFPFLGFFSGNGEKVVGGIAEEIVQRLILENGSKGHMIGGRWQTEEMYEFSLTPYEPEILKYVLQEMSLEADVHLLLHSYLSGVIVNSGRVVGIEIINKNGKQVIYGKIFIDATGDADLAKLAGAPFQTGTSLKQNVTLMFTLRNVDMSKMLEEIEREGRIKGRDDWHIRLVRGQKINSERDDLIIHLAGHMDLWDDQEPLTFTAVSWKEKQISLNITRTVGIDPTDADSLIKAEINERRNVFKTYKQLKNRVPGFEDCELLSTAQQVGIRESRRIKGLYILTADDVIECRQFADGIARGAYPIDIHDPRGGKTKFTFLKEGGSYEIPYRCLIPEDTEGLIVTGRCISATHKALGSTRLQATCMALGEAAGAAGSICIEKYIEPGMVNFSDLRDILTGDGAVV